MGKLFEELKRRKVFRVAAVYAAVAWVLIEVTSTILPTFQAPDWVNQSITLLFILGFPIAVILAWAYDVTPEGIRADAVAQSQQPVNQSTSVHPINYVILVLVLLAVGFQVADRFVLESDGNNFASIGTASGLSRRTQINLGTGESIFGSSLITQFALSPDGSRMAFTLDARSGEPPKLYLREFDQTVSTQITDDASLDPFFSPDGERVGFWRNGELHTLAVRNGQSQQLTDSMVQNGGGFWSADDTIYYVSDFPDAQVHRVPATGGEPEILELIRSAANGIHSSPHLLPDGDSLLFAARDFGANGARAGQIKLHSFASGETRTLIQPGYDARYVPTGHVLFMRSESLWAVPFDLERLEITGPDVQVVQGVHTDGERGVSAYDFSDDGLLVYLPGGDVSGTGFLRTLVWADRDGNEETLALTRDFRVPVVSPDGQRLAVVVFEDGTSNIWIYNMARDQLSLLTFHEAADYYPLWTPDGERVVFASNREGGGLWWRSADGTGQAELLLGEAPSARPYAFTPDGNQLVYEAEGDLFLLNIGGDIPPVPLIQSEFREAKAALSPNGRWIAYESDRTGTTEVYVQPFPNVDDGMWMVSNEGGGWPQWNSNGRELVYRTGGGTGSSVWSVQVEEFEDSVEFEAPTRLFAGNYRGMGSNSGFDISPDGSRFLLIRGTFETSEGNIDISLVAVDNWFEELIRLAPPGPQ